MSAHYAESVPGPLMLAFLILHLGAAPIFFHFCSVHQVGRVAPSTAARFVLGLSAGHIRVYSSGAVYRDSRSAFLFNTKFLKIQSLCSTPCLFTGWVHSPARGHNEKTKSRHVIGRFWGVFVTESPRPDQLWNPDSRQLASIRGWVFFGGGSDVEDRLEIVH